MSIRTPAQAVSWASQPRAGFGGMCLKHARQSYNVPARFGHARLAWQNTQFRHVQSNLNGVPVGAPIWMDRNGSQFGHVAIFVGNGRMATTDSAQRLTQVVAVQSWLNAGWRILGWSQDINGVRVINAGGGGGGGGGSLVVDGTWGPLTQRSLQARLGTPVDGQISSQWRGAWNTNVVAAQFVAPAAARGSQNIIALQRVLGRNPDGHLGPNTISSLQARMGTPVEGIVSPRSLMVMEMQRRLNAGTF